MNSRTYNLLKLLGTLSLGLILVACQDTIPDRQTVSATQKAKVPVCETGSTYDTAKKVCVVTKIVRPTNVITWKSDYCICKDNKAVNLGNCSTFCATRSTNGTERLYANFNVGPEISLTGLGSVYGWCNNKLVGSDETANPKCVLEAKDSEDNVINIDVTFPSTTSNSINAEVQNFLSADKTYLLTLVEQGASGARTNIAQVIKYSQDIVLSSLGPLKPVPISQYSCIIRNLSTITGSNGQEFVYYDSAYRQHFYFQPRQSPSVLPAGVSNVFCHDIQAYGSNDSDSFPRLELKEGVFALWDTSDPRFFDNNGNNIMDVNEVIAAKAKNFGYTVPSGTSFFAPFSYPDGYIYKSSENGSTGSLSLNSNPPPKAGYFMAPWVDQSTYKSYCLNSTHYNSSNAIFKALRDVIQVDTEGLYIGQKTLKTTNDYPDNIFIRETDLKQVWFYYKNGIPTAPTDDVVANVAVYFYYPINTSTPFVQSSTQQTYRVRGANEVSTGNSSSGANADGSLTSYPPHDRKIGCVPKF